MFTLKTYTFFDRQIFGLDSIRIPIPNLRAELFKFGSATVLKYRVCSIMVKCYNFFLPHNLHALQIQIIITFILNFVHGSGFD